MTVKKRKNNSVRQSTKLVGKLANGSLLIQYGGKLYVAKELKVR